MAVHQLKQYSDKFDGLSLRERALVLIAVLVVLHLAWNYGLWNPLNSEQKRLTEQSERAQADVKVLEMELKGLVMRSQNDPDKAIKAQIAQLKGQVDQLQERVERATDSLITPTQMARLLEELLVRNESLTLINLATLKSESILGQQETEGMEKSKDQPEKIKTNIYRHGFVLEFEGDYLATLDYLRELESLPWSFFWDGVSFEVDSYPTAKVRLLLHTLSLSEGWIGV
ncbi:MAG: hypothetical protein MI754_02770 [Chromatiales bacterium]|nr:hypothetical protein [Chromatiales bacterium]